LKKNLALCLFVFIHPFYSFSAMPGAIHAIKQPNKQSTTRLTLVNIESNADQTPGYTITADLFFSETARVSNIQVQMQQAFVIRTMDFDEGVYEAGETLTFKIMIDYWVDEDELDLTFENQGTREQHRMTLPHDTGRGPSDLTTPGSGGFGGPDDIAGSPYTPFCPSSPASPKRLWDPTGSAAGSTETVPSYVETIDSTTEPISLQADFQGQDELVTDRLTGQSIDDTTYPTGPNPWLTAEELEREDGLPRVPVNTTEGLVFMPYSIMEEDGVSFVLVGGDQVIGTIADLGTAASKAVALDAVWYPDGVINWVRGNIDATTYERVQQALDYMEQRTPLNFIEGPGYNGFEFRQVTRSFYCGMVYGYWFQNKLYRKVKLSDHSNCNGGDGPGRATIIHEMFHVLGFPHIYQRPDRNNFVDKVCGSNVNQGRLGGIGWVSNYSLLGPWDWDSITAHSRSECMVPLDMNDSWTNPAYRGRGQWMSPHDINAIYRKYRQPLGFPNLVPRLGNSVASGDFDDDGLMDSVTVGFRHHDGDFYEVYLYFYRGVALDESEGGIGTKQIPWFQNHIGYTRNLNDRYVLETGDLNGDRIPEVIVGDPDFEYGMSGRVGIAVVNEHNRFGNTAPWGGMYLQSFEWLDRRDFGLPLGNYRLGEGLATGRLSSSDRDDLLIGLPLAEDPDVATRRGGAVIHMRGNDFSDYNMVWNPGCDNAQFGFAISTLPELRDVDGELRDCMVVGAPKDFNVGAIHVFSAAVDVAGDLQTPMVLKTLRHWQAGAEYGYALKGFRTLESETASAEHYVLTGAPGFAKNGVESGAVYLDRFDTHGNKTFISSMAEHPDYRNSGDRFGEALAVQQFRQNGLSPKSQVSLGIGMPGAMYNGDQTGKVHMWYPWLAGAEHQVNHGTWVTAGPPNSGYGSSIAPIVLEPTRGGFVIGAPTTTYFYNQELYDGGVIFHRINSGTGDNPDFNNQGIFIGSAGDRLSSNL
jgi:hypothetical protein